MNGCFLKRRISSLLLALILLLGAVQTYTLNLSSEGNQVAIPQVSVGNGFMIALDSYGQAYAWGDNTNGTLGNGTVTGSTVPVAVTLPQGVAFTKVSAGLDHVVALSSAGRVYAWGSNANGQLANSDYEEDVTAPRVVDRLPEDKTFVSIAAGSGFSMALSSDGRVYTWGINDKAQLGVSPSGLTERYLPAVIPALEGVFATAIFAGESNAAILTSDGTLWVWGDNSNGHINASGQESYELPRAKTSNSVYFASTVALGTEHTSFAELNGAVKSYGFNRYGQFGNGAALDDQLYASFRSATLAEGVAIKMLAVGAHHSIALSADGKVYTWGANGQQQLGFVTDQTHQLTPNEIVIPMDDSLCAAWIDAQLNTSAVVDRDGFVWTFGENTWGQLGNGTSVASVTAVCVVGVNGSGRLCLGRASEKDVYHVSITARATIPEPSYTVSIPATLEVGTLRQKGEDANDRISSTEFSLSVGNVENLFGEKKIVVDVSAPGNVFELSDGDHKLSYRLYREGSEEPLSPGARLSEFTAAGTVKGYVRIDQNAITRRGDYTGTLCFTFSVVPLDPVSE